MQEPPDDGPTEHHSDTVEGVLHLLGLGRLDLERLSFAADRQSMKLKRAAQPAKQETQLNTCASGGFSGTGERSTYRSLLSSQILET